MEKYLDTAAELRAAAGRRRDLGGDPLFLLLIERAAGHIEDLVEANGGMSGAVSGLITMVEDLREQNKKLSSSILADLADRRAEERGETPPSYEDGV